MAMISCPGCGEQISDKAKKCIHCGMVLAEEPKKICAECGTELEDGATECPKCGCPVEEAVSEKKEQTPQQVEVTKLNIRPHINKKIITIAVIALVVVIAAIFGVTKVQEQKAIEASTEYGKNLETLSNLMLSGAAKAETSGNLIKSVWHNSIFKKSSTSTDPYTRPDGLFFVSDFHTALGNLFSDEDFSSTIDSIKDNQDEVTSMMKKMKNPPEEWKDAYEELQDFYDSYIELTNLVTNPTGSLQTYSSNFNDADSAVSNAYSKMKLNFD